MIAEIMTDLTSNYVTAGYRLFNKDDLAVFAFAANARASMECAARAKWLMSMECSQEERAIRILQVLSANTDEEYSYQKSIISNEHAKRPKLDRHYKKRLNLIDLRSSKLGCAKLNRPPSPTKLISDELKMGPLYRLLSGVVHGQWYAINVIGLNKSGPFKDSLSDSTYITYDYAMNRKIVFEAGISLCECFVISLWQCAKFRLASTLEIAEIIDKGFDIINYPDDRRFWRSR
ncbi:MAG: hypothetical protein KF851_16275 [Pirellulaceae bacterium]|nr:hypothetical protein [Pirellulaceae bacterium]